MEAQSVNILGTVLAVLNDTVMPIFVFIWFWGCLILGAAALFCILAGPPVLQFALSLWRTSAERRAAFVAWWHGSEMSEQSPTEESRTSVVVDTAADATGTPSGEGDLSPAPERKAHLVPLPPDETHVKSFMSEAVGIVQVAFSQGRRTPSQTQVDLETGSIRVWASIRDKNHGAPPTLCLRRDGVMVHFDTNAPLPAFPPVRLDKGSKKDPAKGRLNNILGMIS